MNCLYITYDGLTDNLGASQILPYLGGLTGAGHEITVLSCEKDANYQRRKEKVSSTLELAGIRWVPLRYHKRPPILSTVWDIACLCWQARKLAKQGKCAAVHVRSYVPAIVGLLLQRTLGLKLIFDMRGFWADERVDGGLWDQRRLIYRLIYRLFKGLERKLLLHSDAVVSLTQAAKAEMLSWPRMREAGLEARTWVIPCCVDLDHFGREMISGDEPISRSRLGIPRQALVCGYLGSIGTWYCLDEMMRLFAIVREKNEGARFLFVTPDAPAQIRAAAARMGVPLESLLVVSADRQDVPRWLSLMDLGIFFIRPCYSKISSSATKLGEFLGAGLPVIANHGIGDQSSLFASHPLGHLVSDFSEAELRCAADAIPAIRQLPSASIRNVARAEFSLDQAVESYRFIYEQLQKGIPHGLG